LRLTLSADVWIEHDPDWLPAGEADGLLSALRAELAWEQREIVLFGRPVLQPRLIAWAGELGYRYSGQTLPPRPFAPAAARILARVSDRTDTAFNHVLANRYRNGVDSMGFHADDEPELGPDPLVAIVSFGTARRLILKPRRARRGESRALPLGHGSLLVMGGACQRHFVHGVPREPSIEGERISLTFRRLLREP
jgi:alkylated DNA repair dioxygenase AlkB